MNKKKYIIIADENFKNKNKEYTYISAFPNEVKNFSYKVSYEEYKIRALEFKKFNTKFLPILKNFFKKQDLTSLNISYEKFLHPFLDVFVNIFIDRLIRTKYLINQFDTKYIYSGKVEKINYFTTLQEISNFSHASWHFNQYLIYRISRSLNVNNEVFIQKPYPLLFPQPLKGYKNLSSSPVIASKSDLIKTKILTRISLIFQNFNFRKDKTYQSLGFAGMDYFFGLKNFYGPFGIFKPKPKILLSGKKQIDLNLRAQLANYIKIHMNLELEELLKALKPNFFSKIELNQINNVFTRLLSELLPISFFENLEENCNLLRKRIEKSNGIIGSLINTDFGLICSSIAYKLNKQIIGVQHGGHYGYVETMSLFNEQEYFACNNFITWGWKHFEKGLSRTNPIILPSPRLSEFYKNKKLMAQISSKPLKIKKLIYMANLISRFPKAGTCGHAHIDFIQQITKNCLSLVTCLSKNKIHFYYKPYSLHYLKFFKKYHNDLKKRGKNFFHFHKINQKGLDASITNNFPIIIWDQLGTGALECFVSSVPTIIYWKNIYSREVKDSKTLIEDLKKQNVIIDNQDDLLKTLNKFYSNPNKWMMYKPRRIAIKNFCNKFALVDKNWEIVWKKFFQKLDS